MILNRLQFVNKLGKLFQRTFCYESARHLPRAKRKIHTEKKSEDFGILIYRNVMGLQETWLGRGGVLVQGTAFIIAAQYLYGMRWQSQAYEVLIENPFNHSFDCSHLGNFTIPFLLCLAFSMMFGGCMYYNRIIRRIILTKNYKTVIIEINNLFGQPNVLSVPVKQARVVDKRLKIKGRLFSYSLYDNEKIINPALFNRYLTQG